MSLPDDKVCGFYMCMRSAGESSFVVLCITTLKCPSVVKGGVFLLLEGSN